MNVVSRIRAQIVVAVMALIVWVPSPLLAQGSPTGTLTGTVSDASGGVLPGVTVVARNLQIGLSQQTVSSSTGDWRLPGLPLGTYELTFELSGFKKLVRSGITVDAASTRSVAVSLEVGGLTETIKVSADAALLTTTTATTSRSLTSAELQAVPTSTGSFTHLLSSEAGVSADLPPVLTNGTGNISPSVNGTRTTSTSLFFNGIDATNLTSNEGAMSDNIAPAPGMLQEVKLQTSMYDASTGRSGGGNFQLVTRSGTNAFRGTGHFSFQHENLNNNDYFYEKDGIDKPKKPLEMTAGQISAYVATVGNTNELLEFVADGSVHVTQQGDNLKDKGLDITGNVLRLVRHPQGDTLDVFGDAGTGTGKTDVSRIDAERVHVVKDCDSLVDGRRADRWRLQAVAQRLVIEHDLRWAGGCPVADVPVVDQFVLHARTSHGRRIVVGGQRGVNAGKAQKKPAFFICWRYAFMVLISPSAMNRA
jgi:hypothetical protein